MNGYRIFPMKRSRLFQSQSASFATLKNLKPDHMDKIEFFLEKYYVSLCSINVEIPLSGTKRLEDYTVNVFLER